MWEGRRQGEAVTAPEPEPAAEGRGAARLGVLRGSAVLSITRLVAAFQAAEDAVRDAARAKESLGNAYRLLPEPSTAFIRLPNGPKLARGHEVNPFASGRLRVRGGQGDPFRVGRSVSAKQNPSPSTRQSRDKRRGM